jgi:CRISPR-associated protein Cas4
VATRSSDGNHILAAGEVGAYTVCAQSWKLRWLDRDDSAVEERKSSLGVQLHREWSRLFEESQVLANWIRYLSVLLCVAGVVFMIGNSGQGPLDSIFYISMRSHGLQWIVLTAAALLVIRSFGKAASTRRRATGFSVSEKTISIEGSETLPSREYISIKQGLAGRPDALTSENGYIIPIEMKPLAKKLRDRYAAQLLVYMRLIEEFEGIRPTHGYLMLGPSHRRVRVENSFQKQQWLEGLIQEMRGIIDGTPAKATPHEVKCAKCNVRHRCNFAAAPRAQSSGVAAKPAAE